MHLGVKCSTLLSKMHTVSKQYKFFKLVVSLSNGLAEIVLSPLYPYLKFVLGSAGTEVIFFVSDMMLCFSFVVFSQRAVLY